MGVTRYKKTVGCDCGCNYGTDCGRKTSFLFCYNRSVDIGTLYIKEDAQNKDSKWNKIQSMTDSQIAALVEVLTSEDHIEDITEDEKTLL